MSTSMRHHCFGVMRPENPSCAHVGLWTLAASEQLCQLLLVAKSFVRLIPLGYREVRVHFERRRAFESSFRGPSATFQTHEPFVRTFGNPYIGLPLNLRESRPKEKSSFRRNTRQPVDWLGGD